MGREREVLDVLLVTPGEGVVAMSFCGRVYVPNSWQRTLRLGNPRSEVVGPLSLESISSEHCSEHDFGQKCQSAYCCRNKSLQDNGTFCCAASDATRSLCLRNHLILCPSAQAPMFVHVLSVYHITTGNQSRNATQIQNNNLL